MRMILLIDDGMPVEREWETLDEVDSNNINIDIDDDENDNNEINDNSSANDIMR